MKECEIMTTNYEEIPCPYCGRSVRNTDKFCIFCGSKLNIKDHKPSDSKISDQEREDADNELKESDKNQKGKKDKKSNKNKQPSSEEEDDTIEEMPPEILEQLEAKMNLAVINAKKERLRDRLKELTKELDSELYQYDLKYAKEINLQWNE